MGILESNQRQRLEYGLDMRIQASHPGDAEVTLTLPPQNVSLSKLL
jgi:hypothetical protein